MSFVFELLKWERTQNVFVCFGRLFLQQGRIGGNGEKWGRIGHKLRNSGPMMETKDAQAWHPIAKIECCTAMVLWREVLDILVVVHVVFAKSRRQ